MPKGTKRKRRTRRRKVELQRKRRAEQVTRRLIGLPISSLSDMIKVPDVYFRFAQLLKMEAERMIEANCGAIV